MKRINNEYMRYFRVKFLREVFGLVQMYYKNKMDFLEERFFLFYSTKSIVIIAIDPYIHAQSILNAFFPEEEQRAKRKIDNIGNIKKVSLSEIIRDGLDDIVKDREIFDKYFKYC